MTKIVKCPHCKTDVLWNKESEYRPFCSERCRLQDLGAWFTEEHAIKGESLEGSDDALQDLDLDNYGHSKPN